jgi:hypothetical protein
MRSLMSGYAGYFNRRYKRYGHLFQNRYKSIICEEEAYFLELVRYIHLNPLRVKTVKDINGLDENKYTGHSAIVGSAERQWQDTNEVLGRFSAKLRQAIRLYREFVKAGIEQGQRPELEGGGLLRSYGGWKGVMELRRGREKYRTDERILGSSSFVEGIIREAEKQEERRSKRVSLDTLMKRISRDMGINKESMTGEGRNRKVTKARSALAYTWVKYLGRSGYELARALGVRPQSVYDASIRAEQNKLIKPYNLERWAK